MKLSGIYGTETKECGCFVKHYGLGGLRVTQGCKEHPTKTEYVCGVCSKVFTGRSAKKDSKAHQWVHAV